MAYPLDTAAQNAALDALLGRDFSGIPTEFEVALYSAYPPSGDSELDSSGGYVRPLIDNDLTQFPAADFGKKVAALVALADPTGEWSAPGLWWVLVDHADSTTRWFYGLLTQAIDVQTGDETDLGLYPAVHWNTEGN